MDDALAAYGDGHADGLAGRENHERSDDPDYRVGLVDGQLAAFEEALVQAIRKALGDG